MMKQRCILTWLLIIVQVYGYLSVAQIYNQISIDEGLSDRYVFAIQRDVKGYMWFLTQNGAERFNGKEVKLYRLMVAGREEISNMNLNWLFADKKGDIWEVGKQGRIFWYDEVRDRFQLMYNAPVSEHRLYPTPITYGFMDKEDVVWLFGDEQMYLYDTRTGKEQQLASCIEESVTCMEQLDDTHYLIGTARGLYRIEKQGEKLALVEEIHARSFQAQLNDIHYHKASNQVFLGTLQQGIYVYDMARKKMRLLNDELSDITINCIRCFNDEELLIGTDGAGVYKLNVYTLQAEPYITADYSRLNAMNGNNIYDIYVDNSERIWMANNPFGVIVRKNRYDAHKWLKHKVDNKQSLVNDQVNAVIEDTEGDLWFATNNGVSLYDEKKKQWNTYLSSFNNHTSNNNHTFLSLCEVKPGLIWVGGYNSGVYQIEKKSGQVSYITASSFDNSPVLADKYIRTIVRDKEGMIWTGGYYNLNRLNLEKNKLRYYAGISGVYTIIEKDDEHLWIGTLNGLYLLNKASGAFEKIVLPTTSQFIYSLYQDAEGELYIGTNNGGLLRYDHRTQAFEQFTKDNCALLSNNIYSIIADGNKRVIMALQNGLTSYYPERNAFVNWTNEQGLMTEHFNPNARVLRKRGTFVFGSTDGVIEFDRSFILPREYEHTLVLSEFRLFDRPIYPGDEDSPLDCSIDDTRELRLKWNQNIFSVHVSNINFDYPSLVLYTWRLKGLYNNWSTPSTNGQIRFMNLPSGKYKLEIKAISNENHDEVFEERTIDIIVEQSFWLTYWAMLLYAICLFLIASITARIYVARKRRLLSEEKVRFFINTAHDLRTPLTLIKAPLEEICEQESVSDKVREGLYTVLRNVNALLRLTTNLVNVEKADSGTNKLKIGEVELNSYIGDMISDFNDYTNYKKIRLYFYPCESDLRVWIDREKMESILKNIISNALKYTPEEGMVEIRLSQKKEMWCFEIKDTGIGVPEEEQSKLFKTHFRASNAINAKITGSGTGLLLVSKLVKLHKGKLKFESVEGKGTTFTLLFPIEKTSYPHAEMEVEVALKERVTDSHTTVPTNIPKVVEKSDEEGREEHKKKVLIVEDNDELRNYLKDSLPNYQVQTSSDGEDALLIIKEFVPDLIVSDILMPGMRGDELCRIVKSDINTSHIPVILLTALSADEEVISGLKHGADEYITKPFSLNILRASIENQLLNRARLQERFRKLGYEAMSTNEIELDYTNELDWDFLSRVKKEIEAEIGNNSYHVDMLCEKMGMSRTNFTNKLRALTGYLPADFIRHMRLNHAIGLLKEQKHNINEIAELSGFNDAKYFREVFKKYYHVSPSNYLKEINKKENKA